MARRKLPPSSKKSVNPVVAPAIARRDEVPALDEADVPPPVPSEAPTGPIVAAIINEPPVVDVASEMTAPMMFDAPEPLVAPDDIVPRDPAAPAAPPRRAPPGDCRSLRRTREGVAAMFALVYRHGATLVMRTGTVGTHGEWRIVDYPTPAAAARAYAREVGMYVDDGYVDVA